MLAAQIFDEALALPRDRRELLAECLTDSLDVTEESEFTLTEAWKQKLRRRVEEIRSGTARLVDGETAMTALRAKFAR